MGKFPLPRGERVRVRVRGSREMHSTGNNNYGLNSPDELGIIASKGKTEDNLWPKF